MKLDHEQSEADRETHFQSHRAIRPVRSEGENDARPIGQSDRAFSRSLQYNILSCAQDGAAHRDQTS